MQSRVLAAALSAIALCLLIAASPALRAEGSRYDRLTRTELIQHMVMLDAQLSALQSRAGVFGSEEWYESIARSAGELDLYLRRRPQYAHGHPIGVRHLERTNLLECWVEFELVGGLRLQFFAYWSGRKPVGNPKALTMVLRSCSTAWRFLETPKLGYSVDGTSLVGRVSHSGLRHAGYVSETLWRRFDGAAAQRWTSAQTARLAVGADWVELAPVTLCAVHDLVTLGQSQ